MGTLIKILSDYSPIAIIIILILSVVAIKEIIELVNWFKDYFKKIFVKSNEIDKREKSIEERVAKLEEHDTKQYEVLNQIKDLVEQLSVKSNERTIATCRSTLFRLHKEFTSQGYVTPEGLKTFTEMGKVYEDAGGNDIYHDKLYPEVLALEIKIGGKEHE